MAFYLRKGFNMGPVRLNLSKGGVGVSGGVTGARVGMSPRGAYVHGGRGGLYYRKYARKNRRISSGRTSGSYSGQQYHYQPEGSPALSQPPAAGSSVEIFVDTGVTYPSPVRLRKPDPFPAPDLPSTGWMLKYVMVPGLLLLAGGYFGWTGTGLVAAGFLLTLGGAGGYVVVDRMNQKAVGLLTSLRKILDEVASAHEKSRPDANRTEDHLAALLGQMADLRGSHRKWIDFHGGYHLHEAYAETPDHIPEELLDRFERQSVLSKSEMQELHVALFQRRFESLAGDHKLTSDDERHLRELAERLNLSEDQIAEEMDTLKVLAEIRQETESFPDEIDPPVRLTRGEKCYAAVEGRQLKEKIQQARTIDRIRHKYIGYETDMEGTICLTDKRILIVGDGSRDYRLHRILDVVLSLEDAVVRVILDGRKNPVILTMARPALFAARMQHLLDEQG